MAKAKSLDQTKLDLPKKGDVKKLPPVDGVDKAVNDIHKKKEEEKRITLDVPESVYKAIRVKIIDSGETLKDYFNNLAKKDLNL